MIAKILIVIFLFCAVNLFSQEKEEVKAKGKETERGSYFLDNERRGAISLFKYEENSDVNPLSISITSPDVSLNFDYSTKISKDEQDYWTLKVNGYSTKGLLNFVVDQEYEPAGEVNFTYGHRSLKKDRAFIVPIQSLWIFVKASYKAEKLKYIKGTDFNTSKILSDSAFSTSVFHTIDISGNLNFIASNFTVGTSIGLSKSHNYSDLPEYDFLTYQNNVKDSLGNYVGSLVNTQKAKFGELIESKLGLYFFSDVFLQLTYKPYIPNLYFYYRGLNIFQGSDFNQYMGMSILFNLSKTTGRHLADFGIRFESNAVNKFDRLLMKETTISILGTYFFKI